MVGRAGSQGWSAENEALGSRWIQPFVYFILCFFVYTELTSPSAANRSNRSTSKERLKSTLLLSVRFFLPLASTSTTPQATSGQSGGKVRPRANHAWYAAAFKSPVWRFDLNFVSAIYLPFASVETRIATRTTTKRFLVIVKILAGKYA